MEERYSRTPAFRRRSGDAIDHEGAGGGRLGPHLDGAVQRSKGAAAMPMSPNSVTVIRTLYHVLNRLVCIQHHTPIEVSGGLIAMAGDVVRMFMWYAVPGGGSQGSAA